MGLLLRDARPMEEWAAVRAGERAGAALLQSTLAGHSGVFARLGSVGTQSCGAGAVD
jgi:hypothetical protein